MLGSWLNYIYIYVYFQQIFVQFIKYFFQLQSDNGIQEAHQAGKAIKNENLKFDMVFTSTLKRAFMTANIILSYCDQPKPPLIKNWQLNERLQDNFLIKG